MVAGLKEREVIRETLGRFVPTDVARTLLSEGGELAPEQSEATVLFCDLEGFTSLTETLGPAGIVELLNEYFEAMVEILERHRGVVTQFQGDAILGDLQRAGAGCRPCRQCPASGDRNAIRGTAPRLRRQSDRQPHRDQHRPARRGERSARRAGSATPCTATRSIWPRGSRRSTRSSAPPSSSRRRPRHRWKDSICSRWVRWMSAARPDGSRCMRSGMRTG